MTRPAIAGTPGHVHRDSGPGPAEADARNRIAEARAWQLGAQLRGDLCEYRCATAALQRAREELMRATTVADAL